MQPYLAVDIGASSGRLILGGVREGRIEIEEIYRFENTLITKNGHLCWDVEEIFQNILQGMKQCKALGKTPLTMGIDTWAVDFVLLDKDGNMLGDSVAYRDGRTEEADTLVEAIVPPARLYEKTGIQKQKFNTIYQLAALKRESPSCLGQAERLLMIPEYLNYRLTGIAQNEYTNATSTGLVNAHTKTWDASLLDALGYPAKLFGKLNMPGTAVGGLSREVMEAVDFDCTVVLPATHDTGSAFLAVPAEDGDAITVSSGTWSLVGIENRQPVTTAQSRSLNFTNEGGYDYRYRFLKNIMGLWMIQSIRRDLNNEYTFAQLESMAEAAAGFRSLVDVNDPCFFAPDSMIEAVMVYCHETKQPLPQSVGEVMQCVYRSLARSYAEAVKQLALVTGKTFSRIHIVGGGSRDGYLNRLTAKETGLPVYAGPVEATALGNLLVQMIKGGEFENLQSARAAIRASFEIAVTQPSKPKEEDK